MTISLRHGSEFTHRYQEFLSEIADISVTESHQHYWIFPSVRVKENVLDQLRVKYQAHYLPYAFALEEFEHFIVDRFSTDAVSFVDTDYRMYQFYHIIAKRLDKANIYGQILHKPFKLLAVKDLLNDCDELFLNNCSVDFLLNQFQDLNLQNQKYLDFITVYQIYLDVFINEFPSLKTRFLTVIQSPDNEEALRSFKNKSFHFVGVDLFPNHFNQFIEWVAIYTQSIEILCFHDWSDSLIAKHSRLSMKKLMNRSDFVEIQEHSQHEKKIIPSYNFSNFEDEFAFIVNTISDHLSQGLQLSDICICYPELDSIRDRILFQASLYNLAMDHSSSYSLCESAFIRFILATIHASYQREDHVIYDLLRHDALPLTEKLPFSHKDFQMLKPEEKSLFIQKKEDFFKQFLNNNTLNFNSIKELSFALFDRFVTEESRQSAFFNRAFYRFLELLDQLAKWHPENCDSYFIHHFLIPKCENERFSLPEKHHSAVSVLPYIEARFSNAKVLFIASCNQESLPRGRRPSLFFDERVNPDEFLLNNDRLSSEAYLLLNMLTLNQSQIFLSNSASMDKQSGLSQLTSDLGKHIELLPKKSNAFKYHWYRFANSSLTDFSNQPTFTSNFLNDEWKFSYRDFENYTECPYRFYLQHHWKLRETHFSESLAEKSDFGNFLHSLIMDLHQDPNFSIENANDILLKCFEKRSSEMLLEQKNYLKIVLFSENGLINKYLEFLSSEYAQEFQPIAFEIPFAFRMDINVDDILRKLIIKGRIDRIERNASSQLILSDLKTGASINKAGFSEGRNFQLAVYHRAYQAEHNNEAQIAALVFLHLNQKNCKVNVFAKDNDKFNHFGRQRAELINTIASETEKKIEEILIKMIHKEFPLNPNALIKKYACPDYCFAKDYCRIKESIEYQPDYFITEGDDLEN